MQNNSMKPAILAAMLASLLPIISHAELNTQLPTEQEEQFSIPLTLDLPAQPLAAALRQFAIQSDLSLTVDSALVVDKKAPAVKGRMTRKEAVKRLLEGSGLQGKIDGEKILIQRATKEEKQALQLDKVEVRAKRFYEVGPLPGLGLTKEQIPGNVQSISAKEIKEAHSLSITDLMNRKLQSVTVNDYQGNPFQMDVQYRGFTAGPQIGTPQGLSVFIDGIRVNEPFGDVVNWDMIPMNALAGVDVFPGSNPIFGLNTLGGAFSLKTKDGFNNAGADVDILTGSFGRKQLQAEGGWNNGTVGLFAAGNFFLEDGWRENSPSKVNQLFTKASYRGDKLDLNLSTLLVQTNLVGNGLLPSQMYEQDRNSVFTSPDRTKNQLAQFQLSGSYFVDDSFTITGQIYRRNSKRTQKGSDVFTDYKDGLLSRRRPNPGDPANGIPAEEYTCLFASTNGLGIPDYYVIPANESAGEDLSTVNLLGGPNTFQDDYVTNGYVSSAYDAYKNTPLDPEYASAVKLMHDFYRNTVESVQYVQGGSSPPNGPPITDSFGNTVASYTTGGEVFAALNLNPIFGSTDNVIYNADTYFYKTVGNDLIKYYVIFTAPTNLDACQAARADNQANGVPGQPYSQKDAAGNPIYVDGAEGGGIDPLTGRSFPGVVEGTPTAIINNNQIDQVVDGASLQLNWSFDKHKFMVGMSIDVANADYSNTSQLAFLDANRNAYIDPAQAAPQFIGAMQPISNNNFEGTQTTQSIYFSETWSPIETLHISTSGRYNQTHTKNKIAARYGLGSIGIGDLDGVPDEYNTCDGDCSTNRPPVNYRESRFLSSQLDPAETEKFSFYSFNPSLGATWQATQNLNAFINWAQGTRVPSVVELGCAFDDTPTPSSTGAILPRSIAENRQCTLPTTLSGDPFLPQIKATTYDIGLRGALDDTFYFDRLSWNVGAYQTDLKDDIYFVAVGNGAGFFQTIGKTRRRGIEAGFLGQKDRWSFGVNYSLTDATFEDNFLMLSNDNSSSSANIYPGFGNVIEVKKGSRMPGVALQNLNANVSFDITPEWRVGLTTVMHSESFLRGNENNEHRVGVIQDRGQGAAGNALRRPTNNPGKVDGYATFNFQTSYKLSKEWTATMLINNIFDKEYFTAGRLGRNPFSPSLGGAIGPDGYNHNSNDWLSTNFIAPGAPRGVWFSLNWHFVPD
ncbi:TonB-dependent receptor [Methylophilus sp. 14]|uniref:TonB-dependent receptor domain-containing protein n=1 Tax=Methylophilus sp. 14 TaxID=2781019 RepID=UPI0018901401|nr:TonB-dependent receptor [Methylophilus sp. 14]MBF4987147.1 TonB-dependent receptor [Methylophilus sp. 14]